MSSTEEMQELVQQLCKLARNIPILHENIANITQPDVCDFFLVQCQAMRGLMGTAVVAFNTQLSPLNVAITMLKSHRKTLSARQTEFQRNEMSKHRELRAREGLAPVGSEQFKEEAALLEADIEALMEGKPRILDPNDDPRVVEQIEAIKRDPVVQAIKQEMEERKLTMPHNPFLKFTKK